jgi:uncharacterized protein YjbJ (UPF0337 family)
MINRQVLGGKWHELAGRLKAKWGQLADDDLLTFNGNVEQLIGRIQHKTGETREAVERFLDQLTDEGSSVLSGVRDKVEETAGQAADSARESYEALRQGYAEAEKVVQQRPGQAVAIAFGLGLLGGLGVALLLRDRNHESKLMQGRAAAEHFGRQMLDALAGIMPDSLTKKPRG